MPENKEEQGTRILPVHQSSRERCIIRKLELEPSLHVHQFSTEKCIIRELESESSFPVHQSSRCRLENFHPFFFCPLHQSFIPESYHSERFHLEAFLNVRGKPREYILHCRYVY